MTFQELPPPLLTLMGLFHFGWDL
ncbi:hypothetical protein LINGRAPRIM_LOCUS1191 [Linum grandiflorum]